MRFIYKLGAAQSLLDNSRVIPKAVRNEGDPILMALRTSHGLITPAQNKAEISKRRIVRRWVNLANRAIPGSAVAVAGFRSKAIPAPIPAIAADRKPGRASAT